MTKRTTKRTQKPRSQGEQGRSPGSDRFFHTFVRDRRCAQCWNNVQIEIVNDREELVCPDGCQPGGHVSAEYVEIARSKNESEAREIALEYPDFEGSEEIIGEQLTEDELREAARDASETLFG